MQEKHSLLSEQEQQKDQEDFKKVREYIKNNSAPNAMQIANATGVSVSKITKFIQQGAILKKF
ncbi:hypothetical protein [Aneurinibacillus tyrosinisolvens]|jgi:hypothetical protein|uniref:hypothetical protein n=1 Tax=Aneurinibacillus tyrosinisolvens TaxID=1443435 RepID=UPI00063EF10A|nr:hypothetical protein [Aneurinibacillus tyrosinisolvens]